MDCLAVDDAQPARKPFAASSGLMKFIIVPAEGINIQLTRAMRVKKFTKRKVFIKMVVSDRARLEEEKKEGKTP